MPPSNKYDKKKKENQKEGDNGSKSGPLMCCVPADKVYCQNPEIESLSVAVKCTCSSGKCTMSGYMHTECFAKYEEIIVGYMSKAGRGRTWNDKQRYANVWANKGYDLVFKTCVCDCGHGSLRKDVDWVPPKPEAEAQAPPPEKKKKKEKAEGKLKPKLNFAVQTVQGSYYGSANREEEDGEDKPAPSLPSMRAFVRETSVDILVPCTPTTPKSSTPAAIPGLASLLPASSKTKTEPKVERSISQASLSSLPTSSVENDPDGWITVSKAKERSESGSRRNSVHQIKPREVGKKRWPSGDSTSSMQSNPGSYLSNSSSGNTNGAVGETAVKTSKCATPEPSLAAEAARKLQKSTSKSPLEMLATSRPSPKASPSLQSPSPFPNLPMFQPSGSSFSSYSTQYAGTSSALQYSSMEPASPSLFSSTPYESALTYTSRDSSAVAPPKSSSYFGIGGAGGGSSLGARPKNGKLSSSPDDIFHSSDEEDRSMEGLLKELAPSSTVSNLSTTPGSLTPKWEEVGASRGDADKDMAQVWEQTQLFDQQLNNPKMARPDHSELKANTKQGGSEGKRDANGFINCTSCKTVHQTTQEFVVHCRSSKHIENSIWAEKLAGGSSDLTNTLGWGGFGNREDGSMSVSTWEHELRPSKDPASLSPLDSVVGQGVRSRAETPESRKAGDKVEDEVSSLRAELEKERAAKAKAIAEVERERAGKRMLEKQSLIVENTLKAEEAKSREFKEMMERLSERLKRQEFEAKSGMVESPVSSMTNDAERKLTNLEETLAAEVAKNESNAKVIKKLKEKVERAEKASVKEKDLKLLAEKTLDLVSKDKRNEESKRKEAEAALTKALAKVKEVEAKVKEEMRKRIAAEVELATVKEAEVKRKAEAEHEQSDLAASVKQLIKEKEEIERKNDEARVEAVNRLEARGCQGSVVQKIVQDSEDIVKKTLERAVESSEDIDSYGDVSKIFKIVSEAMLKPGSSMNSEISDMVSEITGTYNIGLEKVEAEQSVEKTDFETVASEPNIETKGEEFVLVKTEVVKEEKDETSEQVEIKKPEEMDEVNEEQVDVAELKCDDAEADIEPEHDEKTVDNQIKDDQGVEGMNDSKGGEINPSEDDQQTMKDPFDALVDQSAKHQQSETVVGKKAQDDDVFENPAESLGEGTGKAMERAQPISVSSSKENISEEVEGLDRYPKLGLDHEIDPYLGSPTLSRSWSPLEKVEEPGNDLTLTELTVEPSGAETGEKVKKIQLEEEDQAPPHEPRHSSSGSSPAAWPLEMSESSTSGLGSEVKELLEENTRLYTLEGNMQEMQHMIVTLGTTVTSLNNQVEDSKMRNGLLLKTVGVMQEKNDRLERTVESVISRSCGLESKVEAMLGKHSLLERRFSQNQLKAVHGALDSNASVSNSSTNSNEEVSGMKDSLLELLTSCETFQKGFDDMSDKQSLLEVQTKSLREDTAQFKAESDDLREQFAKLSDKFSSLNLECQVDKGNIRAQLEQLGYNIALLTTKLPTDSFPSHKDSSTSGIKSAESSEADTTSATPPPASKDVRKIVSELVFSNEAALAADLRRTSASPKTAEKTTTAKTEGLSSSKSNRKVVYNQNAVNHLPQPPFPGMPGSNLWMSPDGGMVAIPPNGAGSGNPPRPPMPMWGMGGMGRGAGMGGIGQPFVGAPMYPLNYPMFYPHPGPPR